ncbi:MAG: ankyrin repeat domain-containing protein [Chloroflexi bacterium]|nr:ankyrin repeat domain-containing protein [Chloroflexota bacterium]
MQPRIISEYCHFERREKSPRGGLLRFARNDKIAQIIFWIATAAFLSACVSAQPAIVAPTVEPTPLSPPTVLARENEMALIENARRGDVMVVKKLLAQGANVHAHDADGVTALIAAAYGNHLKTARVLIAAGADVNIQDATKQSAFLIATSEGYVELLKLTLQAGADVHRTDSYNGTGLIRAAHRGHVEVIQELLKTEIKINHVNRLGWTALLEAIILGDGGARHTEVVRLLVNAGADVNLADNQRVTPLAHARQRGYADIIAILERAGAR